MATISRTVIIDMQKVEEKRKKQSTAMGLRLNKTIDPVGRLNRKTIHLTAPMATFAVGSEGTKAKATKQTLFN